MAPQSKEVGKTFGLFERLTKVIYIYLTPKGTSGELKVCNMCTS